VITVQRKRLTLPWTLEYCGPEFESRSRQCMGYPRFSVLSCAGRDRWIVVSTSQGVPADVID
jgi:hypothetical protein